MYEYSFKSVIWTINAFLVWHRFRFIAFSIFSFQSKEENVRPPFPFIVYLRMMQNGTTTMKKHFKMLMIGLSTYILTTSQLLNFV